MTGILTRHGVTRPALPKHAVAIGGEVLTLSVTSGTLAGQFSATIPKGTTEVICIPTAQTHWDPLPSGGDANAAPRYTYEAGEIFIMEQNQFRSSVIKANSSTPKLGVLYVGYPH